MGALLRSAGWPGHTSAAQGVKVEVAHGLSAIAFAIKDEARAPVGAAELLRELLGFEDHAADQGAILGIELHEARDVLFGDDEEMNRGLRRYVVEGEHFVVLINRARGDFAAGDLAEDAVGHTATILDSARLRRRGAVGRYPGIGAPTGLAP